jgi:Mn-dependent DtxR family transcriptional regulator
MIPEDLTAKQAETLRIYRALTEANDGITPTVAVLADKLGVSRNAAHVRLMHLRAKGYLTMPPITQTRLRISAKGKKVS